MNCKRNKHTQKFVKLTWHRDNSELQKKDTHTKNRQINMAADTHLMILVVSVSLLIGPPYMAWVECSRGEDSSGGGGSGSYHDVAFIESPQYSVALPGDSVYFNCRTNLPASLENITWLHNGRPLPWKLTTGGKELKQTGGMFFTNFLICS